MKLLPFNKFYYKMNSDYKDVLADGKPDHIHLKDFIFNMWVMNLLEVGHSVKQILELSPKGTEKIVMGQFKFYLNRLKRPLKINWGIIEKNLGKFMKPIHRPCGFNSSNTTSTILGII